MKLTYRGRNYESHSPALELIEGETCGKYRGTNYRPTYVRHIPVPQPVAELKYRGATYYTGDPIDVEAMLLRKQRSNAEAALKDCGREQVVNELSNTHLANIRKNLEHRLQVARAKGDQNLVNLLEAEAKQLAHH
jgi:hypothetical protein